VYAIAAAGATADIGATYSRPELSAAQAATLWDLHAVPSMARTRGASTVALWHARRLLRPESRPEQLSAATVAGWSRELAAEVSEELSLPGRPVPAAVATALMARPELSTAWRAATTRPDCAQARAMIDRVGALAAQKWPGLDIPSRGMVAGELRSALTQIGSWRTPTLLHEHAAATWTSPACLSTLPTAHLSGRAAARVATLWLLPALAAAGTLTAPLASAAAEIVAALYPKDARTLQCALLGVNWRALLNPEEITELIEAFELAEVPLDRAVMDEQVRAPFELNLDDRAALFAQIEARAGANPDLWGALGVALGGGAVAPGLTWAELLDAMDAMNSAAVRRLETQ